MHNKILNETDFNLLYQQKQALVAALYDHEFIEPDVLEGLINFLDVIGDWAEKEGKFKYPEHTEPDDNMLRQELYSMKDHLENLFLTDSIISRARTIAAEGEALSKDLEKLKNVPTVER